MAGGAGGGAPGSGGIAEGGSGAPPDGGGGGSGAYSPLGPRSRAESTRPENPSRTTTAWSRPPAPARSTCQRPYRPSQALRVWSMTSPRERAYCVAMATASGGDSTLGGGGRGRAATTQAQTKRGRTAKRSLICLRRTPARLGGCAGQDLSKNGSPGRLGGGGAPTGFARRVRGPPAPPGTQRCPVAVTSGVRRATVASMSLQTWPTRRSENVAPGGHDEPRQARVRS